MYYLSVNYTKLTLTYKRR